ncbi:germ cell-specific gene 1 protein-like isoform X2 [Pelmatolapia mariae]|uniref:germ cell-specific gene 1 protein-like isoform X2 n=1 Tax=Pelmatolapia mariae TaxID=158779 RepID=UPI002FE69822
MAFVQRMRSPCLSFVQTFLSLLLSTTALMSSYWCVGKQKVPKPLCSPTKQTKCIPVPGVSNSSRIQFFWETGDDRFVFPNFHTGLFIICEENIYIDEWGLLGMVGHMMFMQVFQTTASMGPEDFKPHSYGYSWAFYVAWLGFTICMAAGVSTLNNYTKKVLMVGPRRASGLNPCSFNFMGLLPPAPYYTPPNPASNLTCPLSPPRISHLSPYYAPPSETLPPSAPTPRLTHSHSLPISISNSFPPPPSHPAPGSPFHRLSLPSPSPSPTPPVSYHTTLPRHQENHYEPEEDYSPL